VIAPEQGSAPSTHLIGWHLHKVIAKLGIGSRKELRQALSELGQLALPA
jgi:hypothetical protein